MFSASYSLGEHDGKGEGEQLVVADTVIYNGRIMVQDGRGTIVAALATKGERVLATGTSEQVRFLGGPATRFTDLEGRTVLPGFIDAHTHFISAGLRRLAIDLGHDSGTRSVGDILGKIREAAAKAQPGKWVRGTNYDQYQLRELRHPLRRELDEVAPDNPVVLYHYSGHAYACNSMALERAGIGPETPDPKGGVIERVDGELTGLLKDTAQELIRPVNTYTLQELERGLRDVDEYFLSHGVTTTEDMWVADSPEDEAIRCLLSMISGGRVKTRIVKTLTGGANPEAIGNLYLETGLATGFGNDCFRLGAYKIFLDGTPEVATAALDEPYAAEPGTKGLLCLTEEEFGQAVREARSRGWQFSAHVIGERAVRVALDAFESCEKEIGHSLPLTRTRYPYRLEHVSYVNPSDFGRFARLGVQPVVNPVFIGGYSQAYDDYVGGGEERQRMMDPVKSFIALGLLAAVGSDCPVCSVNPFLGIEPAITRRTCDGRLRNPSEAVSLDEILRMYTYNGAVATGEEDRKGSLEPGKLADFVILSRDLEAIPLGELSTIGVDVTVVGGETVFTRDSGQEG
jgi:predicted amidohydrolase YtcJ